MEGCCSNVTPFLLLYNVQCKGVTFYTMFTYNHYNHNTITIMKAVKTFNGVINRLDRIPAINLGGCAISALAMYRWLEQHQQLTPETCIVYFHDAYDKRSYDTNLSILAKGEGKPKSCCHAVLFHNGQYWDSNGFFTYKISRYSYSLKITDINFVLDSINNIREWNFMFDRDSQLPVIEELLGIELFDIAS